MKPTAEREGGGDVQVWSWEEVAATEAGGPRTGGGDSVEGEKVELSGGGRVERDLLSLFGDIVGLRENGVPGDSRTGSAIRKSSR